MVHERVARYAVTVNGHHTVFKLRPSEAEKMYPGARLLDKAVRAPEPQTPASAPVPAPAGGGQIKHMGGPWFLLSDGKTRVRGREAALAAQRDLDAENAAES